MDYQNERSCSSLRYTDKQMYIHPYFVHNPLLSTMASLLDLVILDKPQQGESSYSLPMPSLIFNPLILTRLNEKKLASIFCFLFPKSKILTQNIKTIFTFISHQNTFSNQLKKKQKIKRKIKATGTSKLQTRNKMNAQEST